MLSSIKSKIKDLESKTKPTPPPKPKPKPSYLSNTQPQPQPQSQSQSHPSKRGLPWPWDHPATLFPLYTPQPQISWLFNWELWVPPSLPSTLTWIPTVRTAAQAKDILPFLTDISTNQHYPITHLLGFNEPEIPSQANLPVNQAVELWKQFVLPAKQKFGLKLGGPGMSSDVSRSKPWLSEFLSSFSDVEGGSGVDFLVLHWYGPHFRDMQSFLTDMHDTYKLPIWLNEFACSTLGGAQGAAEAGGEDVEAFLREALPWLDGCEWVERYAYFGHGQGMTVGEWVGKKSDFYETAEGYEGTGGRRLSRMGRLYMEL